MDAISKDETLYMLAVVPSMELCAAIDEQRQIFAKKFGFHSGLKPPVHITVCPPFKVQNIITEAFERQMLSLKDWACYQPSFKIFLDGFGFFNNTNRPALIINIPENKHLQNMQKGLANYLRRTVKFRKCRAVWNHHITIGYDDIPPYAMPAIQNAYASRPFSGSFTCGGIILWKHDRRNWRNVTDYPFIS